MREGARAPRRTVVSLGTKLALATVGVLGIVSTLVFVQLTGRARVALVESKQTAATMVADLFAATVSAPLDFADSDAIDEELKHLGSNAEITCAAVFAEASTRAMRSLGGAHCSDISIPDGDLDKPRVFADRIEVWRRVVGRRGAVIGRTVLVFSLAAENASYATTRGRIFRLSFALAAGTALLLIAIARMWIVRPLARLGEGARRVERGDLGRRIEVTSSDEIGELADAFDAMRMAIADREQRLAAATQNLRDLFDHMRQAIVAFDSEGKIRGAVSRQARALFRVDDLEGSSVRALLYGEDQSVDAQAFDEWLSMAFEVSLDGWAELVELAPKEATARAAGERPIPLELEFRPVLKAGAIERVMLLATDVSEKRQLEQTVQTQEEEYARRLSAMRRLVAGGGQVFVDFVDSARERLDRCQTLVGNAPQTLPTPDIDELFRHVHTIKGEARAFDLRDLEAETAKLEEELDELRAKAKGDGFATTGSVHQALCDRLSRARQAVELGVEVFVEASPIGRAALDQVSIQRSDLLAVTRLIEGGDEALVRAVFRLGARPFGETTASLVDAAPTWATKEGKETRVEVDGREVRMPPALAKILPGVLTHLVRNAIAHGIESPATRAEALKPTIGSIRIVASDGAKGPTVTVEDDGQGLDLGRIAERAKELGVVPIAGDVAELVFADGVSTAHRGGALAGRGVGLAAVRAELESIGYAVQIESKRGAFTRIVLRPRVRA